MPCPVQEKKVSEHQGRVQLILATKAVISPVKGHKRIRAISTSGFLLTLHTVLVCEYKFFKEDYSTPGYPESKVNKQHTN